ncbi:hypothetical protein RUND412_010239, partial [Rhizina undulata]
MTLLLPSLLRAFYILSSATILLIHALPASRSRFIAYGKVTHDVPPPASNYKKRDQKESAAQSKTLIPKLLDFLEGFKVPHAFFTHFYVLSVLSSLFWAWQIVTRGAAYRVLTASSAPEGVAERGWGLGGGGRSDEGMGIQQVALVWLCLLFQASRRSFECVYVQKHGASTMWILHYVLGLLFYSSMNIAIWIEGTGAINNFTFTPVSLYNLIGPPSLKSFVGIMLFILASGLQHDCHGYLASLEKYSLPEHLAFQSLICPHYFAECLIYLSLAVMGAPRGAPLNWTVCTGLVLVGVNLGVTSTVNREWYEQKFGPNSV